MKPFTLIRPSTLTAARDRVGGAPDKRVLRAGGIDLIDLLKEGIAGPDELVDLKAIKGADAEAMRALAAEGGGWSIGALVTLAQIAESGLGDAHAVLREAAGSAATPGIRAAATIGGNLLQRPRCWYFRHQGLVCLKKGGDACLADGGENRSHAILGGGPCFIVHPSTLAVALVALAAELEIVGDAGTRTSPIDKLFALPRVSPMSEHTLAAGEVIRRIRLPAGAAGQRSVYEVAKARQSFDWPLAEVAASVVLEGGTIKSARIGLGHVAPVPWRAVQLEEALAGQTPSAELFARVAPLATAGARALGQNAYKIPLTQGLVRSALHRACGIAVPD
ncbi:MAG: FAD binding domain-containing protein [Myxococcales bacterium]|nr:FAD binding domain-containing protein [Myxococcales bacterium]MCB9703301.1 FAD binding domain-containing protein [Myxococcales bacterium]